MIVAQLNSDEPLEVGIKTSLQFPHQVVNFAFCPGEIDVSLECRIGYIPLASSVVQVVEGPKYLDVDFGFHRLDSFVCSPDGQMWL